MIISSHPFPTEDDQPTSPALSKLDFPGAGLRSIMSNGSSRSTFGIWGKTNPAANSSLSHSENWTPSVSTPSVNVDSSGSSTSVTDTHDEVLSRSPQNGRRGNSPDIIRSNSPFLYRQRQATAAQAAALNHSPKDAFLDPRAVQQFPFPEDSQGRGTAPRLKSVMSSALDEDQFSSSSGPTRANSTPPYANQPGQIPNTFTPNTNAQFFTPQTAQRGYFESSRDSDMSSAMRNLGIHDSAGQSRLDSHHRAASPYVHNPLIGGHASYVQHSQQEYQPQQQPYSEYGYGSRQYEDEYNRMPHQGYGASEYPDSYGYDYRGVGAQRGGHRPLGGDDYARASHASRSRHAQDRRGPAVGYAPDTYYRNSPMGYGQGPQYYDGRVGMNPYAPMPRREDPGAGLRSPMLEEFRNNKSKKYELRDIFGHIVEFSGDQHGSRFIQQKLETAISDDKEAVFQEFLPNCLQLMTDVFGNYVIQKFFEHGNQVQKTVLAKQMETHVLSLSLQMYGCRVVQKALEHILAEQQITMVKELDGSVLKCVKDQNGNHVIQKALERVPSEHIQFILNAFHGQAYTLATHPYGCRVIQRMLEYCPEAQASLLEELHRYTQNLVVDQYGNYVSQHIIERGAPVDRSKVIEVVKGQVLTLSKHKFASNVVEKCIAFGTIEERHDLIEEALVPGSDGQSGIASLMKDQYGNYVLQKMLEVGDEGQRNELAQKIKPLLDTLKKFSYGKHLASIERLLEQHAAETQ